MKLPLISDADSRDGTSDKDARLTNVLAESDEGTNYATVRPALEAVTSNSGNGNGLVNFEGQLLSVFGSTLGFGSTPSTIGTVGITMHDFAGGPL